jgi:DNA-directed RNA polymerase subunit D
MDDHVIVKSGDITSDDPDVYPIYSDIEIVRLAPGQKIELTMSARMGRGWEHAKWSPVTVAVVRGEPKVRIFHNKCDLCGECVKVCPKNILKIREDKLIVTDIYKCTTCMLCVDSCPKEAIKVDIDENNSLIYMESVGSLKAEDILVSAFDEIIRKMKEFTKAVKGE